MGAPANLLFPVEFMNRELDFRLFLAALSANRQRRVFIGKADALGSVMSEVRGGVYVGKDVLRPYFTSDVRGYNRLKDRGFVLTHLDEEGAVYMGDEAQWRDNLKRRLDARVFHASDYICAWGRFQRDVFRHENPALSDHIVATGHPRFDLYKPSFRRFFAEDTEALRQRLGPFILINTNFPRANHGLGPRYVFSKYYSYKPDDAEERNWFVDKWAHYHRIFGGFVQLTHRLATAYPERTIVLRPHPSEDHEAYRAMTRGLANVKVIFEGSVTPWILASDGLIHNGCTTAIETHMSGKPIVNFRPVRDEGHDKYLPNAFGQDAHSVEDAVELVGRWGTEDDGAGDSSRLDERARKLLGNLETDSFAELMAVMERALGTAERPTPTRGRRVLAREGRRRAFERAKGVVRPLFRERQAMARRTKRKFPGFVESDLKNRMARVRAIVGRDARCRRLSSELLLIESSDVS